MSPTLLLGLFIVNSFSFSFQGVPAQAPAGCPQCPIVSPPPPPNPLTRSIRPRPPVYPPRLNLLQRWDPRNPRLLANRDKILFIIRELKRNITYDPNGYIRTWVGNNYCLFKGFFCDIVPDLNITALAGVDFNGATFGGTFLNFHRFVSNLPDITVFRANSNNFSGVIDRDINRLRYFYELDLSNNKFVGGFPSSVIGATNLTFVDVRFNTYVGPVPARLFDLDPDLLFLNNNGFNQSIPTNFGNTPALYVNLANNNFTGTIPLSIGRASNTLLEVMFLNNRLEGCLPYEIGYLIKATVFDVGGNLLTGPIPQSFGCLAKLELLNLAQNKFYGTIPESLCRLPNAYNFSLSDNYFTQVGPACRRLIRAGRLNVSMNCIVGLPNQKPKADCTRSFARCPRENNFTIVPCRLSNSSANMAPLEEEEEEVGGEVFPTIDEMTPPTPKTYLALFKLIPSS